MKTPRHWVPDELYEIPRAALSGDARELYAVLCRATKNGSATLGVTRLAGMMGKSRSTVLRTIPELEDAKMLTVERRLKAHSRYVVRAPLEWRVRGRSKPAPEKNLVSPRNQIPDGPFVIWCQEEPNLVSGRHSVGSTAGILQALVPVSESIEAPEEASWEDGQRLAAEASAFARQLAVSSLGPPSTRR